MGEPTKLSDIAAQAGLPAPPTDDRQMAPHLQPPPPSLTAKLAAIMGTVARLPKRGRNDFHRYDYVLEADVVDAVRAELAKARVVLMPEVLNVERTPVGKPAREGEAQETLTSLNMRFTFYDGDSDLTISRLWTGWGTDKLDKGGYKAQTGAQKTFLLKTFLVSTGDDPEDSAKPDAAAHAPATRVPRPVDYSTEPAAGALPSQDLPPGSWRITSVSEPNAYGFVEVEAVNAAGEHLQAGTRDEGVITAARAAHKTAMPVTLTTSTKTREKNGKVYTNTYLDRVARAVMPEREESPAPTVVPDADIIPF